MNVTIQVVCEMFESSCVKIDLIDFEEIVFYIAVTTSEDEITRLGFAEECPKRRSTRGRPPKITGCGNEDEKVKRYASWQEMLLRSVKILR